MCIRDSLNGELKAVRAAKSILASLVLLFSSMPALAIFSGWQQHAPPSRSAQQAPPGSRPMNGPPPASPQGSSGSYQPHLNGPGPHRGDWLRKYMTLPPAQQEKQLQQDPSFRNLPPEQQTATRNLFQRYRNLPDDQKSKVSQAYRRLRGMPPQARNQLLSSDEFRNGYTDDERDLLRGMTDLNVEPSH